MQRARIVSRSFAFVRLLGALLIAGGGACSSSSSPAPSSPDGGAGPEGGARPEGGASDGAAGDDGSGPSSDGEAGLDGSASGSGLSWVSGTRMRAVVQSAGKAKRFVRWHDDPLNVDCDYAAASDSQIRCVPYLADLAETDYDDVKCTNKVGVVFHGKTTPYLPPPGGVPSTCTTGADYFTPGAAYAPAAVYQFDGTNCNPITVDPTATYLHVGAAVDPKTFMAETPTTDPRGTRFSAYQYVASDGSRQDVDLVDGARNGVHCTPPFGDQGGPLYCVPRFLGYVFRQYSDPGCSTPAAFVSGVPQDFCGKSPDALLDENTPQTLTLLATGAKLSGAFQGTPAACTPAPAGMYYAVGAAIPVSSLGSFTVANEGTDRVQLVVARTESGALAQIRDFYDTTLASPCDPLLAADGVVRCLPRGSTANLFTDAMCSSAVISVATGTSVMTGAYVEAQTQTPSQTAVFQIGAKIATPAMTWEWNGTTCTQIALGAGFDYYGTASIAPSALAAVVTAPE